MGIDGVVNELIIFHICMAIDQNADLLLNGRPHRIVQRVALRGPLPRNRDFRRTDERRQRPEKKRRQPQDAKFFHKAPPSLPLVYRSRTVSLKTFKRR